MAVVVCGMLTCIGLGAVVVGSVLLPAYRQGRSRVLAEFGQGRDLARP